MISVEMVQEGFILSFDGRRVLSHTRRSPCLELGEAENSLHQYRNTYRQRRRHRQASALRAFKIVESGPAFAEIEFEGRIRLAAAAKDGVLRLSFTRYDSSVNLFKFRLVAFPDERIYGCGERHSRMDLKLSRVPLWVEDRGVGRGRSIAARVARRRSGASGDPNSTYFPMPLFISSKNYWCAVDTTAFLRIDFRRNQTLIDSWAVPREIVLGFAEKAEATIESMTGAMGRQSAPPIWCYDGVCLGLQGGSAAIETKLGAAIEAGVKVSAVWACDWSGRQGPGRPQPWDAGRTKELYPDLRHDIAALRARGIRFLGCVNPLLSTGGSLYAEASAEGLCVKDGEGKDYLVQAQGASAALVDLSSREAFAWLKETIKRELLGIGMAGWIAEGGECLPPDAVLASGESAALAHNRWPILWAKVNREAIEESGVSAEVLFFVRSGWLGSAPLARSVWAGDQLADFSREDGLPSVVPASLSLGLSGLGFWHSEAGGSVTAAWLKRSPDCLGRWIEMAAFTPFFRTSEGRHPEANAQYWQSPASLDLLARMSEVYAALKPYHVAVAAEYGSRGLPPLRHPWIHYESDARTYRLMYQYLYGRDLMVAPVIEASRSLTELYLPEDDWIHLWSSRAFGRGRVLVDSPPGCPAVFYRASSPFAPLFDAIRRTAKRL
ncbi:MAG TPA: alpha-glucosidase [Rectinemataceae bacterium]|nr:alpha-glucosidase [Rectinemataceae bacterium]